MKAVVAALLWTGLQVPAGGVDMNAAVGRFQAGDCQGVIALLSQDGPPGSGEGEAAYALLATCHLQLGQGTEAIGALRNGLAAHPQSGVLKRMLGERLFRENPLDPEAGKLLEAALLALPGDPQSRHYFAQWAYMNNRDDACADREREALLAPGLSPIARLQMHTLIGLCAGRSGDPDIARSAFEVAWQVNTSLKIFDPGAAYEYVRFLWDNGETERLRTVLDDLLTRAPRHGPALITHAKLLIAEGRPTDAIEAANRALAGDGNDARSVREAHAVLARSYFMVGRMDEAAREQGWIDDHPIATGREEPD